MEDIFEFETARDRAVELLRRYEKEIERMITHGSTWCADNTWKQSYYGQRNRLIELIALGLEAEE